MQADQQEKQFEHLVPMKSCLGREFLALQAERDKQRRIFESSPNKMAADTLAYRRSNIALGRFLDDMIPLILKYPANSRIELAQGIQLDRQDLVTIWTRFAVERYRVALPKINRKKIKSYHPKLWNDLGKAWKDFRIEIRRWKDGSQPYDGSQAMHLMIDFQVKSRLLASAND